MASSQTQGVPDRMAPIELPPGAYGLHVGWSQSKVLSWALHVFLETQTGALPQNLTGRYLTSFPS